MTLTVQIRKKGSLTLPIEIRNKYDLEEGDVFSLIDLGDGSILLTPKILRVNRLGDRVAEMIGEAGVSTDELIKALDKEREEYYHEHYVED